MSCCDIHNYIKSGCRAHLVGIGGVSMASLAEVLLGAGLIVSGSDWHESPNVARLRSKGMAVFTGPQKAENIRGADCVIRTAAAHDDNPEIAAAHAAGISGTHGKTTTTSMCTYIFMAAQLDPTVMIGGTLPLLGADYRVGHGDTIILESCEYCNSFLSFFPTVAVILNIEADHLDFFKDLDDVEHSFRAFADLVPDGGMIVANCEDANTMVALAGESRPMVTFGVEQGDIHCANLEFYHGLGRFDVIYHGEVYAHVELSVPGIHNVKNALAAAAAAAVLGVPGEAVERGMSEFRLPGRRFERKGFVNGAVIYDDYAHHPGELEVLLNSAHQLGYDRVICAFQPHTYTRTHELFDDFVEILKKPDITILAEIFAAREENTIGISSNDLVQKIPGSIYCATLEDVAGKLRALAQPGDLILTVGAGDIYKAGEMLV